MVVIKKKLIDILKYLLLLNFSFFLAFGIYEERITKVCFVLGFILYLSLKFLEEGKNALKRLFEFTQINKFIFIFLIVCFLSIFFGVNPIHSQEVFFQRILPYFILFFIAVNLSKDKKNTRILIFSLLVGAFIVSIGGIVDIFKAKKFIRLFSSYGINCLDAAYFLYTLPLFVGFSLFHPSKRIKILSIFLSIPSFVCFFFHYSRGAWLGFLFAFLVVFFIVKKRRFIIFSLLFIAIIAFFSPLRKRLFSSSTLHPSTWGDRVVMWKAALGIFKKYPALGAGIGNYELLMYKVVNPEEYKEGKVHLHAHSTYLEVLAETGVLGFLSFLSIFVIFFKNKFKKLREKTDPVNLSLSVAVLAVLIADLAGSTILVGINPPATFWFLFGLACSDLRH